MNVEAPSVSVAAEHIPGPRHAVAFFENPQEEYRVLVPFAKACARCGDRCLHFLDPRMKGDRAQALADAGVGAGVFKPPAELVLSGWEETYLRGGRFVANEMLQLARELIGGQPRPRAWANMGWAGHGKVDGTQLVEYESRLNPLIENSEAIVVCVYQAGQNDSETALGVLGAHPWIVVDGRLEPNPVYKAGRPRAEPH